MKPCLPISVLDGGWAASINPLVEFVSETKMCLDDTMR
jgi:hypothetical protein